MNIQGSIRVHRSPIKLKQSCRYDPVSRLLLATLCSTPILQGRTIFLLRKISFHLTPKNAGNQVFEFAPFSSRPPRHGLRPYVSNTLNPNTSTPLLCRPL